MTRGAWEHLPARALDLFGLRLSSRELELFRRYVDELVSWSPRMNLLSRSDVHRIIDRHLLDSLSPVAFLGTCTQVADFGAGAGFPGVPLAIVAPAMQVHLVEARRKRCTFLRHVARTLGLSNIQVWEQRGEDWAPDRSLDATIGRALRPALLAELSRRVLAPGDKLLTMGKRKARRELIGGFVEVAKLDYRLPGGEEHEVVLYTRSA